MARIETVLALITAWASKDIDGVLALLDDEIVWHYAAAIAPPAQGKLKVRKFLESMSTQVGEVRWRLFDYAVRGDRIFVEGVDEYISTEGFLVSAPYAGVVEFRGEKILALREYFDLAVVTAQKAGAEPPAHVRALIARDALKP